MAGLPMVQLLSFPSRKPVDHRHLHHCQYCKELRLAQNFQPPSIYKEIVLMTITLLSLGPLAYYIWSGSEAAFAAWILSVALLAVL